MITPINNHILIKPLQHESFMVSQNGTYEEVGLVLDIAKELKVEPPLFSVGDKVYFDSWLAAKYPTGKDNEYFWLVKFEDIRAVDRNEDEIPK